MPNGIHEMVAPTYMEHLIRDKIVCFSHVQPWGCKPHMHNYLELSYITAGEVEHTLDGAVSRLRAGDYVIVDYGSCHSYKNLGSEPYQNIDCLFLPELLDPALKGTVSLGTVLEHYLLHFHIQASTQNPSRIIFHDEDGQVLSLIERVRRELKDRRAGYREMVRCLWIELILSAMRHLNGAENAMQKSDFSVQVSTYVAEHYAENISLEVMAKQMNYSVSSLSKRFKKEMEIGFARYLQKYRAHQACRLLSTTSLSLEDMTEAVGYHDSKNLAALIKRETGFSPSVFRMRHG